MILKNIRMEKQEVILNSKAIFKTSLGGGLCVREHNRENNKDNYYVYSDKDFREKLKNVLSNQVIKAGFTDDEAEEIKVNPIQCKKVVVKHYGRYIDVTTGIFEMQADKKNITIFLWYRYRKPKISRFWNDKFSNTGSAIEKGGENEDKYR